MQTETHADAAVFERMADEWNSLHDPARPEALFLRAEWQGLWWRCLGRGDLNVVLVRDNDGRLTGIAPWFVEDVEGERTVQTIGYLDVGDYLGVAYAPDRAEAVLSVLLTYLDSDEAPAWDVLNVGSVPHGSPTLGHLPPLAQAEGWKVETRVQDVAPVVTLAGDFETYLEALDGKQRRELRRKLRRAEAWEGGADWYTVGPEHDFDEEVAAFLDLMAMSAPEKAYFLEERGYRAYMEQLAAMANDVGWLRLQFLRVEGQRAAGLFNLVYGNRLMVYNSGFNYQDFGAISPGWVLFGYSIADAIEQGMTHYDFLRGAEDYKYRLGGVDTKVYDIVIRRG
ncbi:MAG: GNAT family N-acetyltransferase [Anaerolineae bacterium]|nr:MAG: GNAT family N-acetyltransferase [Anaerolineae bacterium]